MMWFDVIWCGVMWCSVMRWDGMGWDGMGWDGMECNVKSTRSKQVTRSKLCLSDCQCYYSMCYPTSPTTQYTLLS
jgi:hypothetical protein